LLTSLDTQLSVPSETGKQVLRTKEKYWSTKNLENYSNSILFLIFPWQISKEKTKL